jgi:hypothetical protein
MEVTSFTRKSDTRGLKQLVSVKELSTEVKYLAVICTWEVAG